MALKYSYGEGNFWKLPVDTDVMLMLGTLKHHLVIFGWFLLVSTRAFCILMGRLCRMIRAW